jgi:hypothetical protein
MRTNRFSQGNAQTLCVVLVFALLTGCGGGGGGGNSAPAAAALTGHIRLSTPLVAGGATTFDFPTDTNAKWTQNSAYPTVNNFDAQWPGATTAYFHVERGGSPVHEYLSFYISGSHTVWIWGYTSISSPTEICSLSGDNSLLNTSLCSTLGITVDWLTGTITFVHTPLSSSQVSGSTNDAGIVDGTLIFAPP